MARADGSALDFLARRLYEGTFFSNEELEEILARAHPKEILVSSELDTEKLPCLQTYERKILSWGRGSALSILKDYLAYTQRWELSAVENYLPAAKSLHELTSANRLRLSMQVREQWDIHPHLENLLDECGSAGGSRELRELLSKPLNHVEHIRSRQKFLREVPVKDFLALSKELYDLERLIGRILIRASKPYELLRVRDSLAVLLKIDRLFEQDWALSFAELRVFEDLPEWKNLRGKITELADLFARTLRNEGSIQSDCRELIREGVSRDFDHLQNLYANLETWLADFEEKLKSETGIGNLKLRFNRVAGFYIEVSKAQSAKVPTHFERRQTLVNAERYTHPELKAREEEILGAEDKLERKAKEILDQLAEALRKNSEVLLEASRVVSFIDALCGAERAIQKLGAYGPWVEPTVEEGPFSFEIREGRHPLIEIHGNFVANSLSLGRGKKRILLLTGPNMAGKSTLMRQTGLILILAQLGLRVPAESVVLSPSSGFYSRMGSSDRILQGESTFMVEMKEMAYLLRESDANSFVLMDEVGRGTSTKDGLALAKAFLEHFAHHSPSLTLFATHYHELAPFSEAFENVLNSSMSIKEWKGELVFLRKLIPEAASSSYGLHVAKLAGIHPKILNRARAFHNQHILEERESVNNVLELPLFSRPFAVKSAAEAPEVSPEKISKWKAKIQALKLDDMSPKDAWNLLEQWQKDAKNSDDNESSDTDATHKP